MPTFIDRHPATRVSHAVRRQLMDEARACRVDVHGVRPVGHWLDDGYLYCVLEAPGAEGVCQHHGERGLPCDDLRHIEGLRGTRPILSQDDRLIRAAIQAYWHPAEA